MASLIAFCDKTTDSVDDGRAVYLDFSKAFKTVSNNILTNKWMNQILCKRTVRWAENWLNCGTKASWDTATQEVNTGANTPSNVLVNDLDAGT